MAAEQVRPWGRGRYGLPGIDVRRWDAVRDGLATIPEQTVL